MSLAFGCAHNDTIVADVNKLADDSGVYQAPLPDGDMFVDGEREEDNFAFVLDQLRRWSNHRALPDQGEPPHFDIREISSNDAVRFNNGLQCNVQRVTRCHVGSLPTL